MVKLCPLPYDGSSLEPYISADTLQFHHGKHHKNYVDKTNELVRGTELEESLLEQIIASARGDTNAALYNQAAQVWNHGFYWSSLSADRSSPSPELAEAITLNFGSITEFKAALKKEATQHFASGWAWVVAEGGAVFIETTHDAETLACAHSIPLLVIDVWEHAYYLDHQNARKAYVDAVVDNLLNWDFASRNFVNDRPWQYPA
jgi:superoxide dismutase, Fe-Mn family